MQARELGAMTVCECFVSVVAPVYNDLTIVDEFITEVIAILQENYANYELILVDDGSEDETVAKVTSLIRKYKCIRLIRLSRKFGEEIAMTAGLDSVIGDYVVVMLPNSDPPQLIPKIVCQACNGAEIVFGIRNDRSSYSPLVRMGSFLFHWYCRKIAKLALPKGSTQFRVLSRRAVNAIVQVKDKCRYLRVMSSHIGYVSQSFLYEPINRKGTRQRINFWEAVSIAMNIIIKTSSHPLRFVSWFGIMASIANLLYTGFVIYSYILGGNIAKGWTTLSLQNSAMFFFIFLILTVLNEYIGHILVELENRPLYYVLEEIDSSVLIPDQARKNVVTDSLPTQVD
jgi:glycosyltransferase involved in cell wall biosynthesis